MNPISRLTCTGVDTVAPLMATLSSENDKVLEAGTRALRMVLSSEAVGRSTGHGGSFLAPAMAHITSLVQLLASHSEGVAYSAACVIACIVRRPEAKAALHRVDAVPGLCTLLLSPSERCREGALEALSAISEADFNVESLAGRLVADARLCKAVARGLNDPRPP